MNVSVFLNMEFSLLIAHRNALMAQSFTLTALETGFPLHELHGDLEVVLAQNQQEDSLSLLMLLPERK